ncbi:MAG: hypothetical protein MJ106_00815 [Lentisphaeria bacterium]|nr:hypothetical protein [Lentisphaeria bacterium]
MELDEARELIGNSRLWPRIRNYLAAGGEMMDFSKSVNRLVLLDRTTLENVKLWLDALAQAEDWKKIVDGGEVRKLKEQYPGIYPDVFRYLPYFSKFDLKDSSNPELTFLLLKIKFPEAYELCCS